MGSMPEDIIVWEMRERTTFTYWIRRKKRFPIKSSNLIVCSSTLFSFQIYFFFVYYIFSLFYPFLDLSPHTLCFVFISFAIFFFTLFIFSCFYRLLYVCLCTVV